MEELDQVTFKDDLKTQLSQLITNIMPSSSLETFIKIVSSIIKNLTKNKYLVRSRNFHATICACLELIEDKVIGKSSENEKIGVVDQTKSSMWENDSDSDSSVEIIEDSFQTVQEAAVKVLRDDLGIRSKPAKQSSIIQPSENIAENEPILGYDVAVSTMTPENVHKNNREVIVFKNRNGGDADETFRLLKQLIPLSEDDIEIEFIIKTSKGSVIIGCNDSGVSKLIRKAIKCDTLDFELKTKINPQLVIHGIPIHIDAPCLTETIESAAGVAPRRIKFVDYKSSNDKIKMAFVDLNHVGWRKLLERKKLSIDLNRCPIKDLLPVQYCKHCRRWGHPAKFCLDGQKKFHFEKNICSNCDQYNKKFPRRPQMDIRHHFTNTSCPRYKIYVDRLKNTINYGDG